MKSYARKRNGIDTLGVAQRLEDGLVAERVLAALHHQLQLVVDALRALLLHRSKTIRKTITRAKNWPGNGRNSVREDRLGILPTSSWEPSDRAAAGGDKQGRRRREWAAR